MFGKIFRKKYSYGKLELAYSTRDSLYLQKAFLNASNYIKLRAVELLGQRSSQKNLDFLLVQFKEISDKKLQLFTLAAIVELLKNKSMTVSNSNLLLIKNNLNLLSELPEKIDYEIDYGPITFRDKLGDHLIYLQNLKESMNYGGF